MASPKKKKSTDQEVKESRIERLIRLEDELKKKSEEITEEAITENTPIYEVDNGIKEKNRSFRTLFEELIAEKELDVVAGKVAEKRFEAKEKAKDYSEILNIFENYIQEIDFEIEPMQKLIEILKKSMVFYKEHKKYNERLKVIKVLDEAPTNYEVDSTDYLNFIDEELKQDYDILSENAIKTEKNFKRESGFLEELIEEDILRQAYEHIENQFGADSIAGTKEKRKEFYTRLRMRFEEFYRMGKAIMQNKEVLEHLSKKDGKDYSFWIDELEESKSKVDEYFKLYEKEFQDINLDPMFG